MRYRSKPQTTAVNNEVMVLIGVMVLAFPDLYHDWSIQYSPVRIKSKSSRVFEFEIKLKTFRHFP